MERTKIDYCDSTWNPVSGCYHDCFYCYARSFVKRFTGNTQNYEAKDGQLLVLNEPKERTTKRGGSIIDPYPCGFMPTFHRYRLKDLDSRKYGKTIFVCSMADLFGDWVPEEWIRDIFNKCLEHPEHRYLFLTKNPKRYEELAKDRGLPAQENFWYGTTLAKPGEFFHSKRHNCFLSIEPIIEYPFEDTTNLDGIGWIVAGAMTGRSRKRYKPTPETVHRIRRLAADLEIPLFMKDSLANVVTGRYLKREVPWRTW